MNRAADWMRQAERDLQHARNAIADQDFEWACFAAQQAAEKGLKSAFQSRGKEGWGHSVTGLCQALSAEVSVPAELLDAAKRLDKHYIPSRYPNGFPIGTPSDYYFKGDADQAVSDADQILRFCQSI
jgi:HEPN domain-containing protein